jgi:hypothetical protein
VSSVSHRALELHNISIVVASLLDGDQILLDGDASTFYIVFLVFSCDQKLLDRFQLLIIMNG